MNLNRAYAYIFSNRNRTVLYAGVTNLERRIKEHKAGMGSVFTKKYNVYELLFYEKYHHIETAIKREKQLREWNRQWKPELIKEMNPGMINLAQDWE